jgi:hypothetical protein
MLIWLSLELTLALDRSLNFLWRNLPLFDNSLGKNGCLLPVKEIENAIVNAL